MMELAYGAEKSANPKRNLNVLERFAARLEVLPYGAEAAAHTPRHAARTPLPCCAHTSVMLRVVAASRNYQGRTTTMNRQAFVYILASQRNRTLYTGVTRDMVKRIFAHKTKLNDESFTAKYNVDKLVWYQAGRDITAARRGRWH